MYRFILAAAALTIPAFAIDGTILINQSTVMAAGGFPYHITQSGSYKLSGNLVAPGGAILITAANVSLDMNGFTVSCSSSCATTGIGSNVAGTTLINGTVTGYSPAGGSGINFTGTGGKVDRVNASVNFVGISAGGDLLVTNCTVTNGTYGIYATAGNLTVLNSIITGNVQDGIDIFNGVISASTIANNGNGGTSLRGGIMMTGGAANITNNLILNNSIYGLAFAASAGGSNTGFGLNTFSGNTNDIGGNGLTGPWSTHNNICSNGTAC